MGSERRRRTGSRDVVAIVRGMEVSLQEALPLVWRVVLEKTRVSYAGWAGLFF